jgi:hypothetical protein
VVPPAPEPAAALRAELGELPVLAELTPGECAALLTMIGTARREQREALNDALEDVLRFLPRLVRVAARKILFG